MSWHELTLFVFCDLCLAFWHPYFGYHCEFKDATQRPGPVKSWCQSWFLLLSLISCWLNAWCNTCSTFFTWRFFKFHISSTWGWVVAGIAMKTNQGDSPHHHPAPATGWVASGYRRCEPRGPGIPGLRWQWSPGWWWHVGFPASIFFFGIKISWI